MGGEGWGSQKQEVQSEVWAKICAELGSGQSPWAGA